MIGPSFIDEIDCGNFFDHIDDLLDFPEDNNNNENGGVGGGNCNDSFPSVWSSDVFPGSDSVFSGGNNNSNSTSDLSAELSVPYEDIVQLEWLSNFVEDSFSGGGITFERDNSCVIKEDSSSHNHFHTSSPVSVLESSSSCSGGKTMTETPAPGRRVRARSKRPRPATFNPRPAIQLISPTSSFTHPLVVSPKVSSESENFAESRPFINIPKPTTTTTTTTGEHKKKKKIKLSLPLGPMEANQNTPPSQSVRKCMHCEITKTPQWRAGPMGPKTLCNACGVRYKSGRLFPEYRPAASPTFVPSLHSNSHKKVVEMRSKVCEEMTSTAATPPPELIPNSNPLLEYI